MLQWVGPCSVKLQSNCLLMTGAAFSPCQFGLRHPRPGIYRLYGKATGDLLKDLLRDDLPGLLLPVPLSPWQATADPCLCRRPSNTHRQVWLSFLWGYCSFFLGLDVHRILFVPSESGVSFPQVLWRSVLCSFSLVLGCGVFCFGGFQRLPFNGCSTACCSFSAAKMSTGPSTPLS